MDCVTCIDDGVEQDVAFSAARGRYVRLQALSEVAGRFYTSVAEIGVFGVAVADQPVPSPSDDSGSMSVETDIDSPGDPLVDTPVIDPSTLVDNPAIELLPQSDWTVHYVDSEELVGVYRPASYAIDGDPSTFWITEWSDRQTPYPHELQIDLGQTYELHGLRYLPRQKVNQGLSTMALSKTLRLARREGVTFACRR